MKKLLILLWGLWPGALLAQRHSPDQEALLDAWMQSLDLPAEEGNEEALAQLYEQYAQWLLHPMNLNTAEAEDLRALRVLSEAQIGGLLRHRAQFGPLLHLYELQAVEGWDVPTIRRLLPFIRVGEGSGQLRAIRQAFMARGNQQLFLRQRLDPDFRLSDSLRRVAPRGGWMLRFRSSYSRTYSIGLTMAQDALEPWKPAQSPLPRPDFLSAHAVVYGKRRLRALALGDYQLQLGQGLLLSGGFQLGKGSEAVNGVRRAHTGLRPYTSGTEYGFLRGAAASVRLSGSLTATGWVSAQRVDALPDTLLPQIASLPRTGLHRSERELAGRKALPERWAGANLTWAAPSGNSLLGVTATAGARPLPLKGSGQPYQHFQDTAARWAAWGGYGSTQWRNWHFFGETAWWNGHGGAVAGAVASFDRHLQAAFLVRRYSPGFRPAHGRGFAEGSVPANERGWYVGLQFVPSRRWKLAAYADHFRFPWLRYRVDAPSAGHEHFVRLTFQPARKASAYVQYKASEKPRNLSGPEPIDGVRPVRMRQWQAHAYLAAGPSLTLQARLQGMQVRQEGGAASRGWSFHQDVGWSLPPFRFTFRLQYFDTESYDSRQYVYEQDVLYAHSFPAFQGRGFRQYVLAKARLSDAWHLWFKYGQTVQGSGAGRYRQRGISWQVLWKF